MRLLNQRFPRQYIESGWRVFACCRNPDQATPLKQLASMHANSLSLHKLDVSDFDEIDRLSTELADQDIDLLLNNAAVFLDTHDNELGSTDYEAWIYSLRVNSMRRVIEQLTLADSGKFYAYNGKEIAW